MSYIPASTTFNDLIIKKLQGKPFTTTAQSGALEAPGSTFNKVFNNNIYAEDIPISYYDAETNSVGNTVNDSNGRYLYDVYDTDQIFIKYYKRVRLGSSTVVPGQAFKFIGNDEDPTTYPTNILLNGIASYGNYTITIEESSNGVDFSPISSSNSNKAWWYDPASGYVTFFLKQHYVASNDNASSFKPYITFWRYEGDMGIKLNNIEGNLTVTGDVTATSFTATSDVRLKKQIKPLENSLEKICALQGVEFEFINDLIQRKNIGFIAQDIEKIIPQVVSTSEKGDQYKSVAYGNIVALLVEAIKELNKLHTITKEELNNEKEKTQNLKNENKLLKTQINDILIKFSLLEERMNKLELVSSSEPMP